MGGRIRLRTIEMPPAQANETGSHDHHPWWSERDADVEQVDVEQV